MLKRKFKLSLIAGILSATLLHASAANADTVYLSVLGGAVMPKYINDKLAVLNEQTQKTSDLKVDFDSYDKSWNLSIGMFLLPNIALEGSLDYVPKYDFLIDVKDGVGIHSTTGKVEAKLASYSLNLGAVYNLGDFAGFSPYLVGGVGWAKFKNTESSSITLPNGQLAFKIASTDYKDGVFSSFIGAGITRTITDSIRLNLQLKGQFYHGMKVEYQKINVATQVLDFHDTDKTLSVFKLQLGIMFAM